MTQYFDPQDSIDAAIDARNLGLIVNGGEDETVTLRTGRTVDTLARRLGGLETTATAAVATTQALIEVAGVTQFYATRALAVAGAANLADGIIVVALRDALYGGQRVYYRVDSGETDNLEYLAAAGNKVFPTSDAFFANTLGPGAFADGEIVATMNGDCWMAVPYFDPDGQTNSAIAANRHHVQNAGGAFFRVMPKNGVLYATQCGATRDRATLLEGMKIIHDQRFLRGATPYRSPTPMPTEHIRIYDLAGNWVSDGPLDHPMLSQAGLTIRNGEILFTHDGVGLALYRREGGPPDGPLDGGPGASSWGEIDTMFEVTLDHVRLISVVPNTQGIGLQVNLPRSILLHKCLIQGFDTNVETTGKDNIRLDACLIKHHRVGWHIPAGIVHHRGDVPIQYTAEGNTQFIARKDANGNWDTDAHILVEERVLVLNVSNTGFIGPVSLEGSITVKNKNVTAGDAESRVINIAICQFEQIADSSAIFIGHDTSASQSIPSRPAYAINITGCSMNGSFGDYGAINLNRVLSANISGNAFKGSGRALITDIDCADVVFHADNNLDADMTGFAQAGNGRYAIEEERHGTVQMVAFDPIPEGEIEIANGTYADGVHILDLPALATQLTRRAKMANRVTLGIRMSAPDSASATTARSVHFRHPDSTLFGSGPMINVKGLADGTEGTSVGSVRCDASGHVEFEVRCGADPVTLRVVLQAVG